MVGSANLEGTFLYGTCCQCDAHRNKEKNHHSYVLINILYIIVGKVENSTQVCEHELIFRCIDSLITSTLVKVRGKNSYITRSFIMNNTLESFDIIHATATFECHSNRDYIRIYGKL